MLRMYSELSKRFRISSSVGVAHRAQQHRDRQLALAVDADVDAALLVDLQLEPRAAGRHQVGDEDLLLAVLGLHQVGARRAHQLRHDDALGAVDDERAALGHPREIAHEHRLLADLTGLAVDERHRDRQRARVREVLLTALLKVRDRLVEGELAELHGQVARVVLDRRDVVDRLAQTTMSGVGQPGRTTCAGYRSGWGLQGPCSGARNYGASGGRERMPRRRLLGEIERRAGSAVGGATAPDSATSKDSTRQRRPCAGLASSHGPRPGGRVCGAVAVQMWAATTIG